jgi:hypothetical protein
VLIIVEPLVNEGNEVLSSTDDCELTAALIAVVFDFPAMIICGNWLTVVTGVEVLPFTIVAENEVIQVLSVVDFRLGAVMEVGGSWDKFVADEVTWNIIVGSICVGATVTIVDLRREV